MFNLFISPPENSLLYSGSYDPILVVLSIALAILASYASLLVSQLISASTTPLKRRLWTLGGGLCLGGGIWAMHFVGMLAFSLPCSSSYDLNLTLLSTIPGILASVLALRIISRPAPSTLRLILGGLLIGAGIGTMHYSGMSAMRLNGFIRYDLSLFLLSIVVAIVLATFALWIKFRLQSTLTHWNNLSMVISSILMGLAVSGMHYTAMAAAYFIRDEVASKIDPGMSPTFLAGIVLASTGMIIVVTIVGTYIGKPTLISVRRSYKLIATLACCWGILAWLSANYYYEHLSHDLYQSEAHLAKQDVEQVARNMDESVALLKGISRVVSHEEATHHALQQFGDHAQASLLSQAERKQRWASDKKLATLNRQLALTATNLGADNIYILNAAGDCVAASNADQSDSFVGTNYVDRDYFRQARTALYGHQYAVGRTSNIPGLYYSSAVMDNAHFLGVVVVKRSITKFARWTDPANAFLADANGVIVLASEKHFEFRYLPNAPVMNLSTDKIGLQYKQSVIQPLQIRGWESRRFPSAMLLNGNDQPLILASQNLPEDGITVYAHRHLGEITRFDSEKIWLFLLVATSGWMLILGSSVMVFYLRETRNAAAELRIAATAFEAQEGMMISDSNNQILRVNSAFTSITGYSAKDVIGKKPRILSSDRHDAHFYTTMWESINRAGTWEGEIWNRRKNGEVYPEYLNITAVRDADNRVLNYVATFNDITKSKIAENEIYNLAFYDPLTLLPNRRLFTDRLGQALTSRTRNNRVGAILFIDMDNFKALNDAFGHGMGDSLLQQVAKRLIATLRECDTVARLGGDEFVVMMEDLSTSQLDAAEQTEAIGEEILMRLHQPYQLGEKTYITTASIGATLFNDAQREVDELMKQADIAMYQSKKAGRNTLRFFDPEMQEIITSRATMEIELRKALVNRELQLYFQIQVDSSQHTSGAEVLLRWLHPEKGIILPAQFISLAEDTGLIIPIGKWVLETACIQLKAWQQDPLTRELVLAVNVSAKQFRQADFANQVQATIAHQGIDPKLLKLELTESMLIDSIDDTIAKMNILNAIGVQFSLDDFGTGYSSLQYLKSLPLDQIKIDQSFVRDITLGSSDKAIVRTIIAMAESLKLDIIAEGVETEAQRQLLLEKGCLHFQGYLFSEPLPIKQFEMMLKNNA